MASPSKCRVAVVGAGIVGMSTAVRIAEELAPAVQVTVLAEHFSPHTTGDVAAGFFNPYIVHGVSEQKLRWVGTKASRSTFPLRATSPRTRNR
ncbi:hypothetical protein HPB48_004156 [Haemaphysalis longicornis]|uniref:FAD dependent oxidoreductase domain-containing protein n=1 Tax=Haemaphysalis longicornis TaxID=44386 RepID=A0A9J6FLD8_HAELO|nr:hypothetical protein HPB48_004156 [Haemaphysalis longicornis]